MSQNISVSSSFASVILVAATLAGCHMHDATLSQAEFEENITGLLGDHDSVVIEARRLTSFPWGKLCFERNDELLLKFDSGGSEVTLTLPYEEFFVDEGYVENSLEDMCVLPGDKILVKKKYPGYKGPIEFQKAT